MKTQVIYDSQFGNTERLAQVIANALSEVGEARAIHVGQARVETLREVDLLILGTPIQGWKPTLAVQAFLDRIPPASLNGLKAACFDTRVRLPFGLSGSAADAVAKSLRSLGAELLAPAEGFFVTGKQGPLKEGELERADSWAASLGEAVQVVGRSHVAV